MLNNGVKDGLGTEAVSLQRFLADAWGPGSSKDHDTGGITTRWCVLRWKIALRLSFTHLNISMNLDSNTAARRDLPTRQQVGVSMLRDADEGKRQRPSLLGRVWSALSWTRLDLTLTALWDWLWRWWGMRFYFEVSTVANLTIPRARLHQNLNHLVQGSLTPITDGVFVEGS